MDLAVGLFNEPIGELDQAGAVNIIYVSTDGLHSTHNQLWSLETVGTEGAAKEWDLFGVRLEYIPPDTHIFPWPMFLPDTTNNIISPMP